MRQLFPGFFDPGESGDGSLAAPSNLVATAVSTTGIDLTWDDNSDDETGFSLERDGEVIYTPNPGETSYSDVGLDSATTYTYRIRAVRNEEYSEYSNEDSATTQEEVILIFDANDTWTCPANVIGNTIAVQCWGGGGGGQGGSSFLSPQAGPGGGGGGYSVDYSVAVVESDEYTIEVGAAGTGGAIDGNGVMGGVTYFRDPLNSVLVSAPGGLAGKNGTAGTGGSSGATYTGGNGANATPGDGGGGGSSGGVAQNGNDASGSTAGGPLSGGGAGGNGSTTGAAGQDGSSPGGGGGGGNDTPNASAGGSGAPGRVRLTYVLG